MQKVVQFRIFRSEKFYVADCLNLPIVTQAASLDELMVNIKEAVELRLDGEDLNELDFAPNPAIVANIEIDVEYA